MPGVIKKGKGAYVSLQFPERLSEKESDEKGPEEVFDSLSCFVAPSACNTVDMPEDKKEPEKKESRTDLLEEARIEAAKLIEEAEIKASAIVSSAETDAIRIRAEAEELMSKARIQAEEDAASAYEQGFEQGTKDGENLGLKKYEVMVSRLEELMGNIRNRADALVSRHERQIVSLVMETVRQIVGREAALSPDVILDSIRAAMALVVSGTTVDIHINPEDYDYIGDKWKECLGGKQGISVTFTRDASVTRGGCLVETGFGLVDATIEGKMQAVSDEINRVLNERTGVEHVETKSFTGDEAVSETEDNGADKTVGGSDLKDGHEDGGRNGLNS